MRSVLMILGVLLHASNVYMVNGHWEIHDTSATSPVFGWIVAIVASFRMPAFFVIAGFFAQMMLLKHGGRYFVSHRIHRLLVPLLTTALLLNTTQLWLQSRIPILAANSVPVPDSLSQIVTSGRWWQHLWFLIVLLIFSLAALPGYKMLKRPLQTEVIPANPHRYVLATILLLGPLCELLAHSILHSCRFLMDGPFLLGILDPAQLLSYAPFFVFGLWMYSCPRRLEEFCHVGWPTFAAAIAIVLVQLWLGATGGGRLHSFVEWGYAGLIHWLGCHLCFSLFWWAVKGPSNFWRYCSDASYTIYLTHHLLVVVVAGSLLSLNWSPFAKFAIVCSVVSMAAFLIHELLVRRIKLLSYLFNGK